MQVINLFAGPGAGKSTTAAGVFHRLKLFTYCPAGSFFGLKHLMAGLKIIQMKSKQQYILSKKSYKITIYKNQLFMVF